MDSVTVTSTHSALPHGSPALGSRALGALGDPAMVVLLATTLALQLFAYSLLKGYPNADAVEYLDRAQLWVSRDLGPAAGTLRSLGFSSLFVPLFLAAELFGIEDLRLVPHAAIGFQIFTGLALVFTCARLGQKLIGRRAGLVAGWAAALNPFLVAYSVNPVSGLMCALFVALAFERGLFASDNKSARSTGLLLGLSILMAMQAIPVATASAALLALRNGRNGLRATLWMLGGFALGLGLIVILDRVTYGEWGISIKGYFLSNFGSAVTPLLMKLGLTDWARQLYQASVEVLGGTQAADVGPEALRRLLPPSWYFKNLPSFLVWPVLAVSALGLLRALVRPRWASSILVVVLALNVAVLSGKGSKEFRLWLPLIPATAPLFALAYDSFMRVWNARWPRLRTGIVVLALASSVPLVAMELKQVEWRKHGSYWDAVRWIEDHGMTAGSSARAFSAYGWAVHLRSSPKLRFLRPPIDAWRFEDKEATSDAQREALLQVLGKSDWFVTHLSVLQAAPSLTLWTSKEMAVRAVFYDQEENSHLGPVLVMQRAEPQERAARMLQVWRDRDPAAYMREHAFDRPVRFSKDGSSALLLGWDYQRLPGGWGWLTLHWHFETAIPRLWKILNYLFEQTSWTYWYDDHYVGMGMLPDELMQAGTILAEGRLVVPSERVFIPGEPFRPVGGNFRRGEQIPTLLCAKMALMNENDEQVHLIPSYRPGQDVPLTERLKFPNLWDPRGERVCRDGAVVLGGILVPVGHGAWHPDDGSEVPEVRILKSKKKRAQL